MDQFEKFWSGGATSSTHSGEGFKYIEQEEYIENLKLSNNLVEEMQHEGVTPANNYLSEAFLKEMDEIKHHDNVIEYTGQIDLNQFSYENLHKNS